ncbi:MAG: glycosyltransferase family 1 protein [Patescibacteria group bacterium]|nr:glycosyltransferase family 1 protein [Patescibacteria group bacterium]
MIIGIDIRSLMEGKRSGVQQYLINLMRNLFLIDKKNQYKLFCNAYKKNSLDVSEFEKFSNVEICKFNYPNKVLNTSFWLLKYPKIDKLIKDLDIFFAPNILFSAVSSNCKFVTTIHDLSFDYFRRFYSLKRRFWHNIVGPKKKIVNSDAVICVSQSTASDLITKYGVNKEKVYVVYSGIENRIENLPADRQGRELGIEKVSKKYNLPENFVLFLGAMEPRKNIVGLMEAFDLLKKQANSKTNQQSNLKLIIAGSSGWLEKRVRKIYEQSEFKNDIIFLGYIDEKDKTVLYSLAKLFVYPSFYEGFGFPPLEAMSAGCPVVTSNVGSLSEVCEKAAILVDPYNVNEIFEAMKQGLEDEKLREHLIAEGKRQVLKFDWMKCAKETLNVFNRIC